MLWQRVITSIVLLGLILAAVLFLPRIPFLFFISLVIGLAVWEWSALAGQIKVLGKIGYLITFLLVMAAIRFTATPSLYILIPGFIFWLLAFALILVYPGGQKFWANKPVLMLFGMPLIIPVWTSFSFLRGQEHFEFHILFLFFLVAAADIGAYFSGRRFGKHKLAVHVSPNKTWEGFAGGILACILLLVIAVMSFPDHFIDMNIRRWFMLITGAILIAVFSVAGDLFESMAKRTRNVKDSGKLLPGHGGILDRIDGLTAAAPVYALQLMLLGPEFL